MSGAASPGRMLAELTEAELAARARQDDRAAFGELTLRCRASVVNVVYRMCGDLALAEEAAQEAFLRAWQKLDHFDPHYAFRNWVCRIALNAALDDLRRQRETAALDEQAPDAAEAGPEQSLEERQRSQMVRRAVLSLPEASRAVLILREYERLSYQEIAAVLEIPTGTVMSRLNTARRLLRDKLSGALEEVK